MFICVIFEIKKSNHLKYLNYVTLAVCLIIAAQKILNLKITQLYIYHTYFLFISHGKLIRWVLLFHSEDK